MSENFLLGRRWILIFGLVFGIYAFLPFAAPVFMHWGWDGAARVIYFVYSFLCHQLPQRSFFLFGAKPMYSLQDIQMAWQYTSDPLILRQFIGNAEMGWKVAWSDRMVAMFAGLWVIGLFYWPLHGRVKPLRWWGLALLLLPMAIDGTTHMISDLAGIDQGFRVSNAWLASFTGNAFPASFYVGDALGSFNSWMRLISGILFALGIVWFGFPYLDRSFSGAARPDGAASLPGKTNILDVTK